jgi:fructokinase
MALEDKKGIDGRPLVFGEVLFDCFPDGRSVLGGAPFNVAWHLQGFGLDPLLISRIGHDDHGREVLSTMRAWGMDTGGIQQDDRHPTGMVQISLEGILHTFDIVPDQAYDFIDADTAASVASEVDAGLLYYGSLIQRNAVSRNALERLKQNRPPAFVDINLRAPWWEPGAAQAMIKGTRWAKLNDEELIDLFPDDGATDDLPAQANRLCAQYGLELLILTCGAEGAFLVDGQDVLRGEPVPVEEIVDTVGAGDAFSSVCLMGLMRGWNGTDILARALEFAARICEQRGATAQDPALYSEFRARWQA